MRPKGRLLFVLAAALSLGVATPSYADPTAYVLSPDVTGTGPGGVTYTVGATFDWDSAVNLESDVNIVVTGTGVYAGTYTADSTFISEVQAAVPDNQDICGEDAGTYAVCLRFQSALGTAPDTLYGIFFGNDPGDLNAPTTGSFTGDAAAVLDDTAAVPEPTSLALLATGLIGLGLKRRRKAT